MKKICLLAIGSFFSVLAFSQNAATVKTVPGQPKSHGTTATSNAAPSFTNASGTQTPTTITPAQAAKYKRAAAARQASTVPADKAKTQTKN